MPSEPVVRYITAAYLYCSCFWQSLLGTVCACMQIYMYHNTLCMLLAYMAAEYGNKTEKENEWFI